MKVLRGLVPLAVGIVAIGALTWFLLDAESAIGRWLLAALLFAHGWVHLMFVFPQPDPARASAGTPEWPFDMRRSWLVTRAGMDAGVVRIVGRAVMAVAFAALLLAALATVGVLVPAEWWAALVIGGSVASTILLILFYSPMLLLGFGINLALVWLVLGSVWSPIATAGG